MEKNAEVITQRQHIYLWYKCSPFMASQQLQTSSNAEYYTVCCAAQGQPFLTVAGLIGSNQDGC